MSKLVKSAGEACLDMKDHETKVLRYYERSKQINFEYIRFCVILNHLQQNYTLINYTA